MDKIARQVCLTVFGWFGQWATRQLSLTCSIVTYIKRYLRSRYHCINVQPNIGWTVDKSSRYISERVEALLTGLTATGRTQALKPWPWRRLSSSQPLCSRISVYEMCLHVCVCVCHAWMQRGMAEWATLSQWVQAGHMVAEPGSGHLDRLALPD